jgi:hypothetical protein
MGGDMASKRLRKTPKRTAREVIEAIATFPLIKESDANDSSSHGIGYAAYHIHDLAKDWLRDNPERPKR